MRANFSIIKLFDKHRGLETMKIVER